MIKGKKIEMGTAPAFLIFLCICAISLFINVGSYGVVETSDARYAEISREMLESGNYLHPSLLGIKHYHKPPLTYYITTIGYSLFGVTPFGARFFIQLAIITQLIFIYLLSLELFNNKKTALWSALIYFSFPIVLISSRNLTTDPYLATFAVSSMYTWVKYRKTGLFKYLYFFAVCLALGFLTKGPLIFIVPLVFVTAYNFVEPPKTNFNVHHIFSLLIFIVIAGSWFFLLVKQNPGFLKYFIGHQTVDRFASDVFDRRKPFWYYFAIAPGVGLPWLFILPSLLWKNRKTIVNTKLVLVLSAGVAFPFLFFSIASSKLVLYILPLFSLIAIIIAQLIKEYGLNKAHSYIIILYAVSLTVSGLISVIIPSGFTTPCSVTFLALCLGIVIYITYRANKTGNNSGLIYIAFAASVFLLVSTGSMISENQIQINSTQPLSDFIKEHKLEAREILVYNRRLPSLSFHLQKPIVSLYDGNPGLKREVQFEENKMWKENLVNLQDNNELMKLKERLDNMGSVLIVYKNRLPDNRKWLLKYYVNKKDMNKWQIYY